VLALAVVLAFADGFWIIDHLAARPSRRPRANRVPATWMRETTLTVPLFVLAVLGAVTLAMYLVAGGRPVGP
jgi:hypothetical protein